MRVARELNHYGSHAHSQIRDPSVKIFEKHKGNYDAIFEELEEGAEGLLKAKRRGTRKAEQFAREVRNTEMQQARSSSRLRANVVAQFIQGYYNDDVILSNTNGMLMMSKKQLDEQEAIWDEQDRKKNQPKEDKSKRSSGKPAEGAPALDTKPAKALNAVD